MQTVKRHINKAFIHINILQELFSALWKFKLWWAIPVIIVVLFLMLLLLAAGHTGGAALIYPLF